MSRLAAEKTTGRFFCCLTGWGVTTDSLAESKRLVGTSCVVIHLGADLCVPGVLCGFPGPKRSTAEVAGDAESARRGEAVTSLTFQARALGAVHLFYFD